MKFPASRAATLRIEGELDEVSTSDLDPPVEVSVADLQSRIVAGLPGSRLIKSLDLGVGAVVFLYKKPKQSGGVTAAHGLCDQPLAIVKLLRMEDESAGSPQVRHFARGYLHLAVKKAKSQVTPVAGRLLNAENLPLTR